MITTKRLLGAAAFSLAALVSSSSVFAQAEETVSDSSGPGLIGKRYLGADFNFIDYRDIDTDGFGGSVGANLPVSGEVDLFGGYSYGQVDGSGLDITNHTLQGGVVWHTQVENYKPYMIAGLGFTQSEFESRGFSDDDGEFFYEIGGGVEVPLGDKTAGVAQLSYTDGVDSGIDDGVVLTLGVNHWLTDKLAAIASVNIVEDDAVVFNIGGRLLF